MSTVVGGSIAGGSGSSVVGGSIGGPATPVVPLPPERYAQTFGDGVTLVFPITHNLGTLDTMSQLYNPLTGINIQPSTYVATHTSPNVTTFTFLVPPAVGAARAVIDA
jgi:hypothetical protein